MQPALNSCSQALQIPVSFASFLDTCKHKEDRFCSKNLMGAAAAGRF